MARRDWTHTELLLAFNLYCKLPFGLFHQRNPEIIELAQLIQRTPSAVAMKLSNFASFDPKHQRRGIKGLANTSKADEAAWREFTSDWEKTVWESELLIGQFRNQQITETKPQNYQIGDMDIPDVDKTEVEKVIRVRIGQRFFRNAILANYRSSCCVCGMSIPNLLIASHIIPWRDREDLRLNPHNGLCMCALHDKAFDAGFLAVNDQYQIMISSQISEYLPNNSVETNLNRYHGNNISLPDKFMPDHTFLAYHVVTYFLKDTG